MQPWPGSLSRGAGLFCYGYGAAAAWKADTRRKETGEACSLLGLTPEGRERVPVHGPTLKLTAGVAPGPQHNQAPGFTAGGLSALMGHGSGRAKRRRRERRG